MFKELILHYRFSGLFLSLKTSRSTDLFLNEIIMVQIASPVTFTADLIISKIWSIPMIKPIASVGNPTEANTIFKVTNPTGWDTCSSN